MRLPPLNPALFHLDEHHLWVAHCAVGPVPRATVRAVRAWMQKELQPWTVQAGEDLEAIPALLRQELAGLLGGRPEDLSLTANTSTGLQAVAQGFPWREGDEVLAPLGEFPSNVRPWMALASRGVAFREAPLWPGHRAGQEAWTSAPPEDGADPEGALLAALGPRTRILALSWVRFQDGLKLDLARLGAGCAARGVHLVVDGIQGAGTVPVDLAGVAAFAAGGHKGLLAPQGLGFLWTEEGFRSSLAPSGTWLAVEDATDFTRPSTDRHRGWRTDGRRLEPGGPDPLHATALQASLRVLQGAGVPALAAHLDGLQARLLAGLDGSAWTPEARRLEALRRAGRLGSILAFHHAGLGSGGLQEVLHQGLRRGIYASVREGYLRVAFHGYHAEGDVDRVRDWLLAAGPRG